MTTIEYPVIGIKETVEILESGQVKPLSDIYSVEAALELIAKSEAKIEEFKEIKRKRNYLIDAEMENLDSRIEFLKSIIAQTLKSHGKKNVSFPGIGKVSLRNKKGKWVVVDEEALKKVLKDEGEFATIVETEEVIKKGELNKLLDVWQSIGKLPPSVTKESDEDGVTISYEKPTTDANSVPVAIKV